jgi:hypothetical protein
MLLALLVSLPTQLATPPGGAAYSGRQGQLQVAAPRIEATATIDGDLDEPAWAAAARLTDFSLYSPVDGAPADEATEVLVWYSPAAIHFGIRAQAPPQTVRATLASRDKIEADDSIQIFLSTYNDGRQAFVFEVNPLGVQADGTLVEGTRTTGALFGTLQTGRGETDLSADYVFDSKGRLVGEGYTVEVRIPFKTLRYQSAPSQDWGLSVIRVVQSRGHEHSWTPARRDSNSFLAQSGTLVGLNGLRPGLVLDLNPVVTAKMDGAPARDDHWSYDADRPEFGGNVRWGVTPNLTLNGTVNPDFSQVEADAGQFTFDPRQALFFPEKRPFFLDGIEQFTTPNRLIYTRRIVAPLFAAKLTGKVSETGLAFLSALDDPGTSRSGDDRPFFNVLRVQHDLGGQSKLGVVYTDKVDGGYSNRVAGADARLAFGEIYTVELQAALSRTHEAAATTTGPLWEATFDRNGRRFGLRYDLVGIDEDFRADAGFIARPAIARANLDHRLTWFGGKGSVFERFTTDVVLNGVWRYRDFVSGGGALERKLHLNNNADLRGGWKAGASVLIEEFRYDEDLYADYGLVRTTPAGAEILPFVGTPAIDNLDWVLSLDTPKFQTFSASLFYLWGRDENFFEWSPADIVYATVEVDWRPTEQIRASAGYQLQQFKRRSDGSTVGLRQIPRLKVEYQLSRSIFFRVVGEYDTSRQDDLRDDTRTELPIAIRDALGVYRPALGFEKSRLRVDWLFSYQPNPGTVVFAGYGSTHQDAEDLRYGGLRRTSDGFFLKVSYLFRL